VAYKRDYEEPVLVGSLCFSVCLTVGPLVVGVHFDAFGAAASVRRLVPGACAVGWKVAHCSILV
jgi:hypothetical protein